MEPVVLYQNIDKDARMSVRLMISAYLPILLFIVPGCEFSRACVTSGKPILQFAIIFPPV